MEKKMLFGGLSVLSFVSILFMPADSEFWKWLVFLGIIFGILWYFTKG